MKTSQKNNTSVTGKKRSQPKSTDGKLASTKKAQVRQEQKVNENNKSLDDGSEIEWEPTPKKSKGADEEW
jgi:hypothetical protein